MTFIGNNALVGSAIYTNKLDLCSWASYYPPFFNSTRDIFRWPFISYKYVSYLPNNSTSMVCVTSKLNVTGFLKGHLFYHIIIALRISIFSLLWLAFTQLMHGTCTKDRG